MKFSAAIVSIALLAMSALAAPANQKRCRTRSSTAAPATTSTTVVAVSSSKAATTTSKAVSPTTTSSATHLASTTSAHPIETTSTHTTTHAATTSTHTLSPTTSASKSSSTSTSSGIKRGLSYNDISLTKGFSTSKVSWAYNWYSQEGGSLASGVNYFPMLWGGDSSKTSVWMANAKAAIAAGSTHLLFLNEPDLSSQSNVEPATAAQLWMTYMQPFAGQATLVGPAITNGGAPAGTTWLDSFMDECNKLGCQVDAIAGHIYGSASNADYYKTYITDLGSRYGKPLLMTEIGVSDTSTSTADQVALINELVPFLDGLSSVTHYAWFMAAADLLVESSGALSALGQAYENA